MPLCSYTIGREGDIRLNDAWVSKMHALITVTNGEIRIKDLNSCNGTYLVKNNRLIPVTEVFVQVNQRLLIGNKVYSVEDLLHMVGILEHSVEPATSLTTSDLTYAQRTLEMREKQRRFSEERLLGAHQFEEAV